MRGVPALLGSKHRCGIRGVPLAHRCGVLRIDAAASVGGVLLRDQPAAAPGRNPIAQHQARSAKASLIASTTKWMNSGDPSPSAAGRNVRAD